MTAAVNMGTMGSSTDRAGDVKWGGQVMRWFTPSAAVTRLLCVPVAYIQGSSHKELQHGNKTFGPLNPD